MSSAFHKFRPAAAQLGVGALSLVLALGACKREKRDLHPASGAPESAEPAPSTELRAGGGPPPSPGPLPQENIAYELSQGKQLFTDFNCVTCHAQGGGDIGPPLKDATWIYGSEPAQIHDSIVQGRPNGMPAFRGRITENQLWQLVAYVRSLGGLTSTTPAPGRDDDMKQLPENTSPRQSPVNSHPE